MAKVKEGAGEFPADGDRHERRTWFEAQLEGRSRKDCILLAARAALRVALYLSPSRYSIGLDRNEDYLAFFRCQIIAFSASLPTAIDKEQWKTAASTAAAYAAYPIAAFARRPRMRAEAAARSAAVVEAAGACVSAASTVVNQHVSSAAASAAHFVTAHFAANIRSSVISVRNRLTIADADAFVSDIVQLNDTAATRYNLALSPLWPDATPQDMLEAWQAFGIALCALGDDFDIWADWYGGGKWNSKPFPGVLQGTPSRGPSLFGLPRKKALAVSRDIALIPEEFWNVPARVNAELKRIVAVAREDVELGKQKKPPPKPSKADWPAPIPNLPYSVDFGWNEKGKMTSLPSPFALAELPTAGSKSDHRDTLNLCRSHAAALKSILSQGQYQHHESLLVNVESYLGHLPSSAKKQNILSADAAIRSIRDLFSAEYETYGNYLASELKRLLEAHQALRSYYPGLTKFYTAVRTGALNEPLPNDARGELVKIIKSTPSLFERDVSKAVEASRPVVAEPKTQPREPPRAGEILPPADPLGPISSEKAAKVSEAGTINRWWQVLLQGPQMLGRAAKFVENLEKFRAAAAPWVQKIIDSWTASGGSPPGT